MAAAPRQRKQFKFWLNVLKPTEAHLIDVINWLVEQGEFVRSVRDGILLVYQLRFCKDSPGRGTEALLEMFPDIRERLNLPPLASGGGELDEIKSMLELIAAQQTTNQQYTMQSVIPAAPAMTGNLKPLNNVVIAPPSFDDDDDTVVLTTKKSAPNMEVGDNFLRQMSGLMASSKVKDEPEPTISTKKAKIDPLLAVGNLVSNAFKLQS